MKTNTLKKLVAALLLVAGFAIQANAQDWANLQRYEEQNTQLAKPAEGESRVVFMGNSITEGWIRNCPEFFSDNGYISRGISGQTTPQMLLRFRADVINLQPEVVVIMAGTNDVAGNTGPSTNEMIMNNLISMAELARANNIRVIFCSVLPANRFSWRPELKPADQIIQLDSLIENYASANGIPYVDFYSKMVDSEKGLKTEYSKDGVHPLKAGYEEVMNPMIREAIEKLL
ncbi:SGNH/GDSL hydrolase family protein [Mangrovibacterium diazotrophicum]|uniref:Lysophospholipase L1-like esterase n=1 Tax=Mangrovibacterium diazotrophicum TaxID=1261403 RepID=A0A419W4G3_9BACT|nr:SGNH/GDSL hydrolase family protein [Mangrovibacterium diazotrophicum]RKD90335.1 lysophospholipase L1-like esterase [Mangrovibacterium diazotrophicum]